MRSALIALFAGALGGASALFFVRALPSLPPVRSEIEATLISGYTAALVAAIAVVIAVWGVITQRALTRRQVTFDQLARSEGDAFLKTSRTVYNLQASSADGLVKWASQPGSDQFQAIMAVLNEYELFSVGLQRGIIDPKIYERMNRSSVIATWEDAQPFVLALRLRTGRPMLFHEFEELARHMSLNKLPRRSFWWTGLI